ncbi:hypothetical protein OAH18_00505 [bacterium]|nr:hypothetical protein [bacterium]
MMLIYGALRGFVSMLRVLAERRHDATKAKYESSESTFAAIETDCKAEEVAIGRPLDYPGQLRLLKAYEAKEIARQKWVTTAATLAGRKSLEDKIRSFSGLKLPYSFGLVDMALVLRAFEEVGYSLRPDWATFSNVITSLLK